MGYSKWFFSASGVILLVCALALGSKGINFGIDFESGTRIDVQLKQNLDENAVRDVIRAEGLGNAEIQKVTGLEGAKGDSAFQISTDNLKPAEVDEGPARARGEVRPRRHAELDVDRADVR